MTTSIPAVVLGCGAVGDASDSFAKYNTPTQVQAFIALFRSYGHSMLDTARAYSPGAPGTSELLLGQTDFSSWAILDTKIARGNYTTDKVKTSIDGSLAALNVPKVHIMYLHAPDRSVPLAETCAAMDEAYRAGKFEKFGLSNFTPAEVEEIAVMCEKEGWVKPTVYQGLYNAISRNGEGTLFPVLRKHGLSFYAYTPGAGGMFSGKVTKDSGKQEGSRWDEKVPVGRIFSSWYLKDALFTAANAVHAEAEKAGLSGHGVALRWVLHHSALDGSLGDAMIIGASSLAQLEDNLKICAAGPLPENIVKVVDDVWATAKESAPPSHF